MSNFRSPTSKRELLSDAVNFLIGAKRTRDDTSVLRGSDPIFKVLLLIFTFRTHEDQTPPDLRTEISKSAQHWGPNTIWQLLVTNLKTMWFYLVRFFLAYLTFIITTSEVSSENHDDVEENGFFFFQVISIKSTCSVKNAETMTAFFTAPHLAPRTGLEFSRRSTQTWGAKEFRVPVQSPSQTLLRLEKLSAGGAALLFRWWGNVGISSGSQAERKRRRTDGL